LAEDSKFIAPVKPGMFRSPDSFTAVIERKYAFQEVWKFMVAFLFLRNATASGRLRTTKGGVRRK